jgi:hypothetical protein
VDLVQARVTYGNNASANVASDIILEQISLAEVRGCYRHCYKFITDLLQSNN